MSEKIKSFFEETLKKIVNGESVELYELPLDDKYRADKYKKDMLGAYDLTEDSPENEKEEVGLSEVEYEISINHDNDKVVKFPATFYKNDIFFYSIESVDVFFTKRAIIIRNPFLYFSHYEVLNYDKKIIKDSLLNILKNGKIKESSLEFIANLVKYSFGDDKSESNEQEVQISHNEIQSIISSNNTSDRNIELFMRVICMAGKNKKIGGEDDEIFKLLFSNYFNDNKLGIVSIIKEASFDKDYDRFHALEQYFLTLLGEKIKKILRNSGTESLSKEVEEKIIREKEKFFLKALSGASKGRNFDLINYLFENYSEFINFNTNIREVYEIIDLITFDPRISEAILNGLLEENINEGLLNNIGDRLIDYAYNNKNFKLMGQLAKVPWIDIDRKDDDKTRFYTLVENKNYYSVENLLNIPEIDINAKNEIGITALHCAIENKDEQMIEILISSNRLDVNIKNSISSDWRNIDFIKAWNKSFQNKMIENFLKDPNCKIKDNFEKDGKIRDYGGFNSRKVKNLYITPLTLAIIEENDHNIIYLIRRDDIDVNIKDDDIVIPPIFLTIMDNNYNCFYALLRHQNIDLDLTIEFEHPFEMYKNVTPLHFAIMGNRVNMICDLLQHKNINLNTEMKKINKNKEEEQQTPLKLSVELYREGKIDSFIIIELLKKLKKEEIAKEDNLKQEIKRLAEEKEDFRESLSRANVGNLDNALAEIINEINGKKDLNI